MGDISLMRNWLSASMPHVRASAGHHCLKWGRMQKQLRVRHLRCAGRDEVVVGIDLGTTNSAISIVENGSAVIVPDSEGQEVTPSVVSFQSDGTVAVGMEAKKLAHLAPRTTFFSVKRLIGRR